jgi:LPS-assembly protein
MGGTPRNSSAWRHTRALLCAAAIAFAPVATVQAQQIIPANFFSRIPADVSGRMSLEADTMVFNQANDTVVAQGNVGIRYAGFQAVADRAIYYQRTGKVELIGNVAFVDPDGLEYVADRVELEDDFKQKFLESLTVAFPDGTWVTAASTRFSEGVERVYEQGTYAPCGSCIDAKGNTIGWKVRAARITTDEIDRVVHYEQPSLEFLGVQVLWLPWLTLPADGDFEMPVLSYDNNYGIGLSFPFFRHSIAGGTVLFTPTLFSRQGVMLGAEWRQRVGDLDYNVRGSAIYQLDPGAYNGLANRDLRGYIQTSGTFTPTDEWTLGWSYTTFTDPGYLPDYRIATGTVRNQLYATYLTSDTFADTRFQQFVPVGSAPSNWTATGHQNAVNQQALTHPNTRIEHVEDLGADAGRVELSARLLGLTRNRDHQSGGFVHGYAGQSAHVMLQAGWTHQYIVPGGLAVSPYLGVRADAASYDGASALPGAPAAQTMLSATPIAALDIRYPLMMRTQGATTVVEPIAQLVYRDGPAVPGITNDDSQNVTLDTGNLFSFNRFSGANRQETGLRANVGVALNTSFDDGGWLAASIGQSHHLAGFNGYTVADGSTAGIGTGLDRTSSYIVASLEGGVGGVSGGGQLQYDPYAGTIPAANVRATASHDGYSLSGRYAWADVNPALGITRERHDIGADVAIPVSDYWRVKFGTSYDLVANQLLTTTGALEYDDKYLAFGVGTRLGGPIANWGNDFRVEFSLRLRAAGNRDVVDFGYSWDQ